MYDVSDDLIVERPLPLTPAYRISSRDFSAGQYAPWPDQSAGPVDVDIAGQVGPGFVAEHTAWDLGGLVVTHSIHPALTFQRTLRHIRSDGLDHWVVSAPRRGHASVSGVGRTVRIGPGSLSVQSLQNTYEGETSAMEAVHMFVPRDFCRSAAANMDAADTIEVKTGLGGLLAVYLHNLERRLPLMTEEDLPALQDSIRAMVLACIVASPDSMFEARESIQATALERARSIIQQRLFSPNLGTDELCAELGMSRSRLYRLFEPLGGVVHYIRQRRLLAAHVALADENDHRTILQIAAACGFLEPAEFSRAFKREFGYRPTDARGHAAPRARPLAERHGERRTLSRLLHDLK